MSECGMVLGFAVCITVLFICFGGEPDLMDAIVGWVGGFK